jgi:hypothetical protein
MCHPQNKRARFLVSVNKSRKRVSRWFDHCSDRTARIEGRKKSARRLRRMTKSCSACCCGNPRKFFNEITMQEKKFKESLKSETISIDTSQD